MLRNFKRINHLVYSFILFITIFSSCITSKSIKYIQEEAESTEQKTQYQREAVVYKIQSGDNLFIKFYSIEPLSNAVLSMDNSIRSSQGLGEKYRDVYQVDSSGYISLPQLDRVFVKDLSLQQLKDSLDYKMKKFFQLSSMQVRLADNYVTVIGDVNKPGRYLIDFNDKISVFEILGMAGDLKFEANRKEIKLMRNNNNKTEVVSLDLTKRDILENKYYYILPNDIIYVEPLRAMNLDKRTFPFATTLALILATTTSILVILTYIK
jgi:polysaccharide export outer membrane protein